MIIVTVLPQYYCVINWIIKEKLNEEFTDKQNQLKSKIDENSASVEEIKSTPKAVVAFRATCAKNFPNNASTRKDENPGKNLFKYLLKNS